MDITADTAPTFDAARERRLTGLLDRIRPAVSATPADDLRRETKDLVAAAGELDRDGLADPGNSEVTIALAARALELASAVHPAAARCSIGHVTRRRVEARATGIGTYAHDPSEPWARVGEVTSAQTQPAWLNAVGHLLLVEAAIETLEAIVLADPAASSGAAEVHHPARPTTVSAVQQAASAALATELEHMTLDDWEESRALDPTHLDGLADESTPESHMSALLINLYALGRPDGPAGGDHSRAFRHALSALEAFEEDPLPRIIDTTSTAIDGSGLGGGARPWVARSVDASTVDAMLCIGPLGALRHGDDAARGLVTTALQKIAQRELVLVWSLSQPA